VAALYAPGVAAAERTDPGDPATLFPEERRAVANAVESRVAEFAAGRECARLALTALGRTAGALPRLDDRRAAWPPGTVGTISHTAGLCVAAAAPADRFRGLGLDVERWAAVPETLAATIATPAELAWIGRLAPSVRAPALAATFSAKEAFYKCQSPVTGLWLEFHDVEIDWSTPPASDAVRFRVRVLAPTWTADVPDRAFEGAAVIDGPHAFAAVQLRV
jgi:4'-phosphopantetheinyl transferase EntD